MANLLEPGELEDRIECFGEFGRGDAVCLSRCVFSFECAAAAERYEALQLHDESLEQLGFSHSA